MVRWGMDDMLVSSMSIGSCWYSSCMRVMEKVILFYHAFPVIYLSLLEWHLISSVRKSSPQLPL
jgi:hypothetical protein